MDKTASLTIDYTKAAGMLTVVAGHYTMDVFSTVDPNFYIMPLFFFIGGLLFSPEKAWRKIVDTMLSKYLLYMLLTYAFLLGVTYLLVPLAPLMRNELPKGFGLGLITTPFQSNFHGLTLFLIGWFLLAYLLVTLAAYLFFKSARRFLPPSATALAGLAAGLLCGYAGMELLSPIYAQKKWQAVNLACQVSVGFMYFTIAYAARVVLPRLYSVYGFVAIYVGLEVASRAGLAERPVMSWSSYPAGFTLTLLLGLMGIYLYLCVGRLLACLGEKPLLKAVGRRSKAIMSYHLLVFILLDIAASRLGLLEAAKINGWSYHYFNPPAWPLYIFAGLLLPVGGSVLADKARRATFCRKAKGV